MERPEATEYVKRNWNYSQFLKKSRGKLYICPFCNSGTGRHHTGAFQIFKDSNMFHCSACGRYGDVFDFMRESEGISFNDALQRGAAELHITIDPYKGTGSPQRPFSNSDGNLYPKTRKAPRIEPQRVLKDNLAYYKQCRERLTAPEAVSYLSRRCIGLETAVSFWIGYDPQADTAESGHRCPRIIIPVSRSHYIGRSIDPTTPDEYKRMNNRATPDIFNMKGLYRSRLVYITEGAFDALSVCEMGETAIALNSASNHRRLIRILTEQPADKTTAFVVAFDNDPEPDKHEKIWAEAEQLRDGLRQLGYRAECRNISGSWKDANEALCADRAAFKHYIEEAKAWTK